MHKTRNLLLTGLALSATTLNAQATLTTDNVDGANIVFSSISNLTWTQDGNLLSSLQSAFGYETLVNAIVAASPTVAYEFYADSGVYKVSSNDFAANGIVNWFGAKAFTNYLSSINYAGSKQWTLPTSGQFSELIREELGDTSYRDVPDTAYFTNEQSTYWSSSTDAPFYAWGFGFTRLHYNYDALGLNVWAVTPGPVEVVATPVPATIWLFASGLIGFGALQRRNGLA